MICIIVNEPKKKKPNGRMKSIKQSFELLAGLFSSIATVKKKKNAMEI